MVAKPYLLLLIRNPLSIICWTALATLPWCFFFMFRFRNQISKKHVSEIWSGKRPNPYKWVHLDFVGHVEHIVLHWFAAGPPASLPTLLRAQAVQLAMLGTRVGQRILSLWLWGAQMQHGATWDSLNFWGALQKKYAWILEYMGTAPIDLLPTDCSNYIRHPKIIEKLFQLHFMWLQACEGVLRGWQELGSWSGWIKCTRHIAS